ncbi:Ribonuclease 3 isoform X1 [Oopsacas minuta]|uniref:Ribonuclease 3 isoform X1 n=1 Tax=Oopsacas minuta TaxID=111878 RepID=A0AAV7JDM8_9METZ|nr:Ribonuclease 3 isoform X1 [Oopsacas minuta]
MNISWVDPNPELYFYKDTDLLLPTSLLSQIRAQFSCLFLNNPPKTDSSHPSDIDVNFLTPKVSFHLEETTFQAFNRTSLNANNWNLYRIVCTPDFEYSFHRSSIRHKGSTFSLFGFSLFSHIVLQDIPYYAFDCTSDAIVTIEKIQNPPHFSMVDVELIQSCLILNIMGLPNSVIFNYFFMFPLFVLSPDADHSICQSENIYILSPHEVLIGLLNNLENITSSSSCILNELVYNSNVLPKVLRVDHIDLINSTIINTSLSSSILRSKCNFRSTSQTILNDCNGSEIQTQNRYHLPEYIHELYSHKPFHSLKTYFESNSFKIYEYQHTGLFPDVSIQIAVILPLIYHIRLHLSLSHLKHYLCLKNVNSLLLECCLTHSSFKRNISNLGIHPALFALIISKTGFVNRNGNYCISLYFKMNRKRSHQLRKFLHSNNERFEFLGDAVIEYLTTVSLFHLLPNESEGSLSIFRSSIVQNCHLFLLADHLFLKEFILMGYPTQSIPNSCKFNKFTADALEAIFGLIFIEYSLSECQKLLGRLLWGNNVKLNNVWNNLPEYPVVTWSRRVDHYYSRCSNSVFDNLKQFQETISITFSHIHLLAKAFTHPSVPFNVNSCGSNGTLEFLGDSILQLLISKYLFIHVPRSEGVLSNIRSSVVNNINLIKIGKELNLQSYIILQPHEDIHNYMIADVFESLIAAIYLDKGMKYADTFCQSIFFKSRVSFAATNPKLKLLIYSKRFFPTSCLVYESLTIEGPTNNTTLSIGIYFGSQLLGIGSGTTRKVAEARAANEALRNLKYIRQSLCCK